MYWTLRINSFDDFAGGLKVTLDKMKKNLMRDNFEVLMRLLIEILVILNEERFCLLALFLNHTLFINVSVQFLFVLPCIDKTFPYRLHFFPIVSYLLKLFFVLFIEALNVRLVVRNFGFDGLLKIQADFIKVLESGDEGLLNFGNEGGFLWFDEVINELK